MGKLWRDSRGARPQDAGEGAERATRRQGCRRLASLVKGFPNGPRSRNLRYSERRFLIARVVEALISRVSSFRLRGLVEPAARETRAAQAADQVRVGAHDAPHQSGAMVLDHRHDRSLV